MNASRMVEFRSYRLKRGAGPAFHALVTQQSVPLHAAAKMDVVAHGPSVHDPDAYLLIRSYDSLEHLHLSQNAFYGSDAWRRGPREDIVALIESDHDVVVLLPLETIEALRLGFGTYAGAV